MMKLREGLFILLMKVSIYLYKTALIEDICNNF